MNKEKGLMYIMKAMKEGNKSVRKRTNIACKEQIE